MKDTEEIVILETAARDMNRQMRTDTGTEGSGKNRSVKKAQGERTVQDLKNLLLLHGQDILFAPGMQREKDFMQHGKVSVFEHSVGVTLVSLMLAEKFNITFCMTGTIIIPKWVCTASPTQRSQWRTRAGILTSTRSRRI